jgi:uncharacterized protein
MIENSTKKTILAKRCKILRSPLSKAIGLMFHQRITDTGYVFVFNRPVRVDLHMFFVFFPIDLIFLDEQRRVTEIKENFRPFTFYISKSKARYVIELPAGAVRKSRTQTGDTISTQAHQKDL